MVLIVALPIPYANHGAGIFIYLPTKLGDFGLGQMLGFIFHTWNIWALNMVMLVVWNMNFIFPTSWDDDPI